MTELARPRFLVVDDDEDVQRAMARVVRKHGELVAATTFQDAMALVSILTTMGPLVSQEHSPLGPFA
jgi:CheY-like chemotaxis protein